MQLFRDLAQTKLNRPTVLSIGAFDGLHRGHQSLIRQLKTIAQELQAQTAVIAFHPRPKTVLAPHLANQDYLTTADERIALLKAAGLDVLILSPFSIELSQTGAQDFVKLVVDRLRIVAFCVGHDFALGKNREGDVTLLTRLGKEFGYDLHVVEPYLLDGRTVSSTQIRQCLLTGDVRQATYLLGRYPALTGTIMTGMRRGHTIGFPTANFAVPAERLLPSNGVYATFIQRLEESRRYPSVTNIGVRPSFGGGERTVETYIFDFDKDIYGQPFTVEFVEYLRPEKKFEGIDALVSQIGQDVKHAQSVLADETITTPY